MSTCDRCGKETLMTTMSWFNTEVICGDCDEAERAHPDFERARATETAAVQSGNMNYPGVGLPADLRRS